MGIDFSASFRIIKLMLITARKNGQYFYSLSFVFNLFAAFILVFSFSALFAQSVSAPSAVPDSSAAYAPYKIEAGDVLEIVILGEDELSRTLMVMHNGTISFPLIGEVRVTGLTTEDIARLLSEKLKTYFTHAVISVILKSPTLPHVSVFGEVIRPGSVEYQRGLRVTDYIALAGGPTNRANLKKVKVVRFVDQKAVALSVNVDDILKKGRQDQNFELKSGDWVYIHKRFTIEWGIVINTLSLAVSVATLYITIQRL
jgi:polysaccharide export outer membrane protein